MSHLYHNLDDMGGLQNGNNLNKDEGGWWAGRKKNGKCVPFSFRTSLWNEILMIIRKKEVVSPSSAYIVVACFFVGVAFIF